jgi:hypothetical protein
MRDCSLCSFRRVHAHARSDQARIGFDTLIAFGSWLAYLGLIIGLPLAMCQWPSEFPNRGHENSPPVAGGMIDLAGSSSVDD